SGFFSIGARLLIPVIALVALVATGVDDETIWLLALIGGSAVIGAAGMVVLAVRSEEFTRRSGEWIGRGFNVLLNRFKRAPIEDVGLKVVGFRARIGATLQKSWPVASLATVLSHVFTYSILLVSMRAVGISNKQIDWAVLLVAYAVVRLLTLIPLTPGGLGVAAAGYTFLLTKASDKDLANSIAAASFLTRIWVWLFPMLVGFVPLAMWRKRMKNDPAQLTGGTDDG
ncbi:MAG: lysylphosphatidylglycerol synthase domain-containing protein, partial [Acidimicrobiia bacterium]|nr:lysylphosphatidylglycerol synthase domain-containing protein [Acidimicrobiia bacterium]